MPDLLTPPETLVAGYDFSTGSVKALAFDLAGVVVAECRFPTDIAGENGARELNLNLLEGQAYSATRALANRLRELGRLGHWRAAGLSATHHTAGRLDADNNPVRRAICWNDQTLAGYHRAGLSRLGGAETVRRILGGPWAERYSLSHLVKDEEHLSAADWARTKFVATHGSLAAGYLTGRFDCVSVSSAASTGLMNFATAEWADAMLGALATEGHRRQARANLPRILAENEPVGALSEAVAHAANLPAGVRPLLFPTLDDQAAGLIGGGAVEAGQVAIVLGNSAVVNSSAAMAPQSGSLDAMRLNHGPYLWMRCYNNGALFLDPIVGANPDWPAIEAAARAVPPGANGVTVTPFLLPEPGIGVRQAHFGYGPAEPAEMGAKVRAAFEALAYLMALAVEEHESAGQTVTRISVSGGIARSELMTEILASVLHRPLERLESAEGPALGAAAAALAGYETKLRCDAGVPERFTVADAVGAMVRFRAPARPNPAWVETYQAGLRAFAGRVEALRRG